MKKYYVWESYIFQEPSEHRKEVIKLSDVVAELEGMKVFTPRTNDERYMEFHRNKVIDEAISRITGKE